VQESKSGNPILSGWYADPEVVLYDSLYWIYPTVSDVYEHQTYFDCFSSRDLLTWERHSQILDTASVSWAVRAMWAPSSIRKDGKYYLFFSANDVHAGEVGGIGVAVGDRPEGPYVDLLGHPLIGEIINGAQPIDQFVYEDDGEYYMYYGGWSHCNVVRLRSDFAGLLPFEDGDLYKEITPAGYTEGPFMFRRMDRYYFMWSEGGWGSPDYSVAYAISDSPLGPFARIGRILSQDTTIATSAGHHSVLHIPSTDSYYIVYHRRPLGDTHRDHRVTCIDRLYFSADGLIAPVLITNEGVEGHRL
jgi:beta-xylosidase